MIRKGTMVQWNWTSGTAEGKVMEVFKEPVTKTIKGTKVKREATDKNRAFYIKQKDGDFVLKSESEVKRVSGK